MDKTIAFIGTGSMGGALVRAACREIAPEQVIISNRTPEKADKLAAETGCCVAGSNYEAAERAGFVVLCVKPQLLKAVAQEIAPALSEGSDRRVLVSIAAGVTIESLRAFTGCRLPIIRVMPNTPALIGQGLITLCSDGSASESDIVGLESLIRGCGRLEHIDESLMDAATAAASCSPAFVYMFIEALADGAVTAGLPRAAAQRFAAQAVLGSAAMVLESGQHPGALKDMVCSPGGSTIAGVKALEDRGFRGAVAAAVLASFERNKELGK